VCHIRPPLPRAVLGKGHILFAHLRQLHLTFHLLLSGKSSTYDAYLVDQLSTCVPLLRKVARKRVVFYGHFPDKLLADGQFVEGHTGLTKSYSIKGIYRIPMDWLEEVTTCVFFIPIGFAVTTHINIQVKLIYSSSTRTSQLVYFEHTFQPFVILLAWCTRV
jgi:hypothetical protein